MHMRLRGQVNDVTGCPIAIGSQQFAKRLALLLSLVLVMTPIVVAGHDEMVWL